MKKYRIITAVLLAAVMVLTLTVAVACDTTNDKERKTELLLWGPSGSQAFLRQWSSKWAEDYTDAQGNKYTVKVGIMEEGEAGTTVMNAVADAADVYSFADDQLTKLVNAGGLSSVGDPSVANSTAARVAAANSEGAVKAATFTDGKLYAYPQSSDNGYFLYYNSDFLSETEAASWESIIAKAEQLQKKYHFDYATAWYQASFFFTFGGEVSESATNFDTEAVGIKALKAAHKISASSALHSVSPDDAKAGLIDGTIIAGVAGSWIYNDVIAGNSKIKLAVLPTITVDNDTKPMKSFLGSKLMGVNGQSKHQEAAHALADYLTSEEVQTARIALSIGPSNINASNSDAAKALPTLQVLSLQAANSVPQINLPSGFWDALPTCVNAMKAGTDNIGDYYTEQGGYNTEAMKTLLAALKTGFKLSA